MKKLAVVFGMLLTFGLLLTSCGAKGPSYNAMTEADCDDSSWLVGKWEISVDYSYEYEIPSSLMEGEETAEEVDFVDELFKATCEEFGADANGVFELDEAKAKVFAGSFKYMVKEAAKTDNSVSFEFGDLKYSASSKQTIGITDAKDSVQMCEEVTQDGTYAGEKYYTHTETTVTISKQ